MFASWAGAGQGTKVLTRQPTVAFTLLYASPENHSDTRLRTTHFGLRSTLWNQLHGIPQLYVSSQPINGAVEYLVLFRGCSRPLPHASMPLYGVVPEAMLVRLTRAATVEAGLLKGSEVCPCCRGTAPCCTRQPFPSWLK